MKNDLEERVENFVKKLIDLLRSLPRNRVNIEFGGQCLRSGGSTGANYIEATDSDSRADFIRRLRLCKREAKETRYWLRLLEYSNPNRKRDFAWFMQEIQELILIFSKSIQTSIKKSKPKK